MNNNSKKYISVIDHSLGKTPYVWIGELIDTDGDAYTYIALKVKRHDDFTNNLSATKIMIDMKNLERWKPVGPNYPRATWKTGLKTSVVKFHENFEDVFLDIL